ncbi:hypothetical protein [Pseudonocardia sp. MH-G8]|uniref:hypothetical protein n=1 Tax=Pseudonocardia sp. MH-G8 TaxID=1854588 RepID=UPI000BA15DB9|nr:hypothetical protein [Pseudonocardia sp. MH-G8]OZM79372.1 hypothetical protein CFP66_26925 [Pseudonocardia sp. MH-G8]
MTWLVWRRQRAALLTAASLVAVFAVVLVAARHDLVTFLREYGVDEACFETVTPVCRQRTPSPFAVDLPWAYGPFWGLSRSALLITPLTLGLVAGAGLFRRERDEGTDVLALTQSTTVTRWWATGLLVAGIPVAVLSGLLGALAQWAYAPFSLIVYPYSPLESPLFGTSGIVPIAYTLLAFTLAAGTGLVARGSLAPVVVAVVGYSVVMFVLTVYAREHYLPAVVVHLEADPDGEFPRTSGTWELGRRLLDDQGNRHHPTECEPTELSGQCYQRLGVTEAEVRTQPDSRYWAFQLIETAILLALSAVHLALTHPRFVARLREKPRFGLSTAGGSR